MTETSPSLAVIEADAQAAVAPRAARDREVFVAAGVRRISAFTRWRWRLSWPLGSTRHPDQTLARRARAAIDQAFPACRSTPAEHVTGQAGTASRCEAADFAD